jgi:putative ABC transport system substrate-binding protein
VEAGLVDSLANPGGNVTGQIFLPEFSFGKLVEMLATVVPDMESVGLLYHDQTSRSAFIDSFVAGVGQLGLEPVLIGVSGADQYNSAISEFASRPHSGLVVESTVVFWIDRVRIVEAVATAGVPAIYVWREFVEAGGLMSYGLDVWEPIRRAGAYVGRILNGADPGNLPIEASTTLLLSLNIRSAELFGLTFPTDLLATADEIFE